VPHARSARRIVTLARGGARLLVVAVPVSACALTLDRNLAGEPWDSVDFNGAMATLSAAAPTGLDAASLDAMGALVRVNQAAGALGTALELAIQ
jgi:acyl-CoA dehydrogenase